MNRRNGHDPVHTFRAPAELVTEARQIAAARGESLSDVVRRALVEFVGDPYGAEIVGGAEYDSEKDRWSEGEA